jgi:hypothetical protein
MSLFASTARIPKGPLISVKYRPTSSLRARPATQPGGCLLASPPQARYHRHLMNDITRLLSALAQGGLHAASRRLRLVYDERRRFAEQRMTQKQPRQTPQPSAPIRKASPRVVGHYVGR